MATLFIQYIMTSINFSSECHQAPIPLMEYQISNLIKIHLFTYLISHSFQQIHVPTKTSQQVKNFVIAVEITVSIKFGTYCEQPVFQ